MIAGGSGITPVLQVLPSYHPCRMIAGGSGITPVLQVLPSYHPYRVIAGGSGITPTAAGVALLAPLAYDRPLV